MGWYLPGIWLCASRQGCSGLVLASPIDKAELKSFATSFTRDSDGDAAAGDLAGGCFIRR